MLRFIARENIKRFEHQLSTAADEPERRLLLSMLRAERDKLEVANAALLEELAR